MIGAKLKVHYDGGSREAGAAAAQVLLVRPNEAEPWQELAFSGVSLGPIEAAAAETTAAFEAAVQVFIHGPPAAASGR